MQNLLIVDDSLVTRIVLTRICELGGFVVDSCESAAGAWAYLNAHPVDALIIDIFMPRESGIELLRRIRENLQFSHLPCVMITAAPTDEIKKQAFEIGADAFMSQPVCRKSLVDTLVQLLNSD